MSAKLQVTLDASQVLSELQKVKDAMSSMPGINTGTGGIGRGSRNPNVGAPGSYVDLGSYREYQLRERERLRNLATAARNEKAIQDEQAKLAKAAIAEEKRKQAEQKKINNDALRASRERINDERRAGREAIAAQRREESAARREARQSNQRYNQAYARGGYGSWLGSLPNMFNPALSRLGGLMPDSFAGNAMRNAVTGGFMGQPLGNLAGGLVNSSLRRVGGLTAAMGPGYQTIGNAISGIGSIAQGGMSLVGMYQGMKWGTIFTAGTTIFKTAVDMFRGIIGTLASLVTRIAGAGMGLAGSAAKWGTAALAGATVGGVYAYGKRVAAERALGVVAGGDAGGISNFVSGLSGNSMFTRTSLLEGAKQAKAFGMSTANVKRFLPLMMESSSLFGQDPGEGMRALVRAATQSEPEAAEKYGLNLYNRNILRMFPQYTEDDLNRDPALKERLSYATAEAQLQRFVGSQASVRNTPSGAIQFLKNKGAEALENFGSGFTRGSGFVDKMNKSAENLDKFGGTIEKLGEMLGKVVDMGVGYAQNYMPSKDDVQQFFSTEDEGTKASKWGDKFFSIIERAMGMMNGIVKAFQDIYAIMAGPDGVAAQLSKLRAEWQAMMADPKKYLGNLGQEIFNIVKDAALATSGGIDNVVSKGTGALMKSAMTSRYGIASMVGTVGGAIAGGLAGGLSTWGVGALPGAFYGASVGGTVLPAAVGAYDTFFDKGGVVDAPEGQPVKAVVHGGEMILNRRQQNNLFGVQPRMYAEGTGGGIWNYAIGNPAFMGAYITHKALSSPTAEKMVNYAGRKAMGALPAGVRFPINMAMSTLSPSSPSSSLGSSIVSSAVRSSAPTASNNVLDAPKRGQWYEPFSKMAEKYFPGVTMDDVLGGVNSVFRGINNQVAKGVATDRQKSALNSFRDSVASAMSADKVREQGSLAAQQQDGFQAPMGIGEYFSASKAMIADMLNAQTQWQDFGNSGSVAGLASLRQLAGGGQSDGYKFVTNNGVTRTVGDVFDMRDAYSGGTSWGRDYAKGMEYDRSGDPRSWGNFPVSTLSDRYTKGSVPENDGYSISTGLSSQGVSYGGDYARGMSGDNSKPAIINNYHNGNSYISGNAIKPETAGANPY